MRKVKPNWKLSQFDTIFRTQVKALRKMSMLKKVAKLLEIVGRSYIGDGQYVRLTHLSSFSFYFVLS